MLKSEKGISMIAVVIIIIFMLIISGVLIYFGISEIKSAKAQSISTNMLQIQAKTRKMFDKSDVDETTPLGLKIEDENKLKEISGEEDISNLEIYILSQNDLNKMEVDVSGEGIYAVDYNNDEIYYLKGIKDKEGNRYYKLSDISNLDLEISSETEDIEENEEEIFVEE